MIDVLEVLKKLPLLCMVRHPSDGASIIVRRGVEGYYAVQTKLSPEDYNGADVTPAQSEAMLVGSMRGWDVPGADPDNYEGNPPKFKAKAPLEGEQIAK
jgi:hypothetical protein